MKKILSAIAIIAIIVGFNISSAKEPLITGYKYGYAKTKYIYSDDNVKELRKEYFPYPKPINSAPFPTNFNFNLI